MSATEESSEHLQHLNARFSNYALNSRTLRTELQELKEQNASLKATVSELHAKIHDIAGGTSELVETQSEITTLGKQLSEANAQLDACKRELDSTKRSLNKSQDRVGKLTTAVAADEEAAEEKCQYKIEALQAAHRAEHAAATQSWHEHSTSRLDTLQQQLQEQFATQTEELRRRCARLEDTNRTLEETNTETLQAAEQAAELANDLMAQLSASERARSAEQTKLNAEVMTWKQTARSATREHEAAVDKNSLLQAQLTKLHAQIDQYATLLEAEEAHHSIGDRPVASVRMLKASPRSQPHQPHRGTLAPVISPFHPQHQASAAGPGSPSMAMASPQAVSPDKPSETANEVRVSIGNSIGYGGLHASFGLSGISPVSPGF